MDLYQLQTFCQVARLMSFTQAATELSLSQSAVSRHIEALEREYGLALFVRKGRGAVLTEAGGRLLEYAERLMQLSSAAARSLGELRDLQNGHLTVGASTTPGHYLLGSVVAVFQDRYPGIDLQMVIRDSQSTVRQVTDSLVDVAVLPDLPDLAGVITEPFMTDELLLVAAPDHPLASRGQVELDELADQRLIWREAGSHTRQVAQAALAAKGIRPHRVREMSSTEAIKQAVTAGSSVAFCSRYALALELRMGLLKALSGPDLPLRRELVLAYPKSGQRPPAVLAFAALLRQMQPVLAARVSRSHKNRPPECSGGQVDQ